VVVVVVVVGIVEAVVAELGLEPNSRMPEVALELAGIAIGAVGRSLDL